MSAIDPNDWQSSELAKTNPQLGPTEGPVQRRTAAGEVEGKSEAPELVEISTVRVLGDLAIKLDPPREEVLVPARTPAVAPRRPANGPIVIAIAVLALGLVVWALVG